MLVKFRNFLDIKETFLDELPKSTHLFYGHEYSFYNLRFAKHSDRENEFIKQTYKEAKKRRMIKMPFLPGVLEDEYRVNLFLRGEEQVI